MTPFLPVCGEWKLDWYLENWGTYDRKSNRKNQVWGLAVGEYDLYDCPALPGNRKSHEGIETELGDPGKAKKSLHFHLLRIRAVADVGH